jgi:hypothetical protein
MKTLDNLFDPVEDALEGALLIAFDGCHKIYLAMDDEQAEWFRQNYNGVHCTDRTFTGTSEEMLATLKGWWDESCGLKFITAVTTDHENPNAGYSSLIGQGEWMDDEEFLSQEDEDDEDEDY